MPDESRPPEVVATKRLVKKEQAGAVQRTPPTIDLAVVKATKEAKKVKRKRQKLARQAMAKAWPAIPAPQKPRTPMQRLERALGPDDGRSRRGWGWLLQGGSPGLGRRS